ncbi:MAG: DUF3160 domain-containing protein [Candidatus Thorarchaeota archaeon]
MYHKSLVPFIFITIIALFAPQLPSRYTPISHNNKINNSNNDLNYIDYFTLINEVFKLKDSEKQLLKQNKFVVLNRMGTEDILDAYKFYWENDLPVFITTDTMLHTWHLLFDHTLEDIEEKIFYPLLSILTNNLVSNALLNYNKGSLTIETLIFFIVANEFTNSSNNNVPSDIEIPFTKIVNAILNEISINSAIRQFNTNFTKRFIDDFSQYKPRGHYTNSESLENYFRLFKWFSRIPFFFDKYAGQIYLQTNPYEMIQSALEIVWLLKNTTIRFLEQYSTGLEVFAVFKSFLDVIVGQTNAITPLIIDDICKELVGDAWNLNNIDSDLITRVQIIVLNDSTIPMPKAPYIIDALAGASFSPKTFLLFGERLTLDSYALNHLVFPYVRNRYLPTSLDLTATCLESLRSLDHLIPEFDNYPGLSDKIITIRDELNNISGKEKQTIHWQWIESLKDISWKKPTCNETPIIPEFMSSNAWLDEKLTTIMGSWAQLKHDLILYSQQSITGGIICSTPMGYVEPYPEFYSQIGNLSQMYRFSLAPLESIGLDLSNNDYYTLRALDKFYEVTQMLERISYKQLTGRPLNDEEKQFIENIYKEGGICGGPTVYGWLSNIIKMLDPAYVDASAVPNSRISLVADIHTDLNCEQIYHLATGLLEPIIAIVPGWEEREVAVVGPVFSFYEFALSTNQRLDDDDWRGILALWLDVNNRENFDFEIFPRGFWAESYMVSTEITTSRIFKDGEEFIAPEWFTGRTNYPLSVLNEKVAVLNLITGLIFSGISVLVIIKKKFVKNASIKKNKPKKL